jgi:hypothetical protein
MPIQRCIGIGSIISTKQSQYHSTPADTLIDIDSDHIRDSFFKDRNWLRLEFQELLDCAKADVSLAECRNASAHENSLQAGPKTVVEIGCVCSRSCMRPRSSDTIR